MKTRKRSDRLCDISDDPIACPARSIRSVRSFPSGKTVWSLRGTKRRSDLMDRKRDCFAPRNDTLLLPVTGHWPLITGHVFIIRSIQSVPSYRGAAPQPPPLSFSLCPLAFALILYPHLSGLFVRLFGPSRRQNCRFIILFIFNKLRDNLQSDSTHYMQYCHLLHIIETISHNVEY